MSTTRKIQYIQKRIDEVNALIDKKIVRGLPYVREAVYHKNLLRELRAMSQSQFFTRSLRTLSTFLF